MTMQIESQVHCGVDAQRSPHKDTEDASLVLVVRPGGVPRASQQPVGPAPSSAPGRTRVLD